jgi:hypothetical protein
MIFVIEIMVSLVVLASDTYEIRLLESIMNYDYDYYTALSLAEINDTWQSIISTISFSVTIFSSVVFFYWFYRAYRNLPGLGGRGLEFTPKWVIAYFFIPILALWKPLRALEEIWKWSDTVPSHSAKSTVILLFWWIPFIIANMLGFLIFRGYLSVETSEQLINLDNQDMALQILIMVSNAIFIYIAKEICGRQEMKSRNVTTVS